jgi:hypothetical protein
MMDLVHATVDLAHAFFYLHNLTKRALIFILFMFYPYSNTKTTLNFSKIIFTLL